MKTLILQDRPNEELTRALSAFEQQFTYPLGPGRTFRISHGDDYPRFFRAMGDTAASLLVTEDVVPDSDGRVGTASAERERVLGTLGVSVRKLLLPEGREQEVAYLGDLKVAPASRTGFVYFRLAWMAEGWLRGKVDLRGFSIVMDGTRATPDTYTGAVGIPAVRILGKIIIWQIPCSPAPLSQADATVADPEAVLACYRELSRGRYACLHAKSRERSEMEPVGLLLPNGAGCGLVEDTRRCKRLIADDGTELRSGHLSFFAYRSAEAGARLLRSALIHAARAGHPALFVAVVPSDAPALESALGATDKVVAPATVFGHGIDAGPQWNINTSEI